ncbi:hypothetical protein J2X31_000906 [Flavobacterium arsenatis]|uniref:Outer membrane protein beta-barrel domain-containing protein n=1 Tax=Flavobacterium arsenatis TaxID=1484332 RepID=A0ABU1TLS8_9FLAO|nr:hypothetical protein [Flavobacterium arsenatis]MDR6966906.1 hypothetical protein [Flavobacterium arsenatis]
MLRNKFLILFLVISSFAFSQSKKIDTVYVYEEIIIRDTIFIEKPFSKIDKAVFTSEENKKDKLELTQNGVVIQIPVDTLVLITDKKRTEKPKSKSWFFGGKFHLGIADNSLFKKMDAPMNTGFGLGIWTKKKLFDSDFSVGIGFDAFYWMSPFSTNAQEKDGALNGYYFTHKNEPKLFHSIESKHFQLQIPIQLYYKIGKFTPSVGGFVSTSNYKTQFLGSSGTLPLRFDQIQTFKTEALQMGYLLELQYAFSESISVGIHFSSGKFNNLVFINKDDKNQSFKVENKFTENRGFLQLVYTLE